MKSSISSQVYVRKLNTNELGYKDGKIGSERGPAVLISKKLADYFPPLSENEFNDHTSVSFCIEGSNQSILLNYIYFNGKRFNNQKNGRDEKRVYISKHHYKFFKPDAYFAFYKVTTGDDIYFYIREVKATKNKDSELDVLLTNKDNFLDAKGNHLKLDRLQLDSLISDTIPPMFVEDEIDEKLIKHLETNEPNRRRARPRIDLEDEDDLDLFENSSFRKLVLFFYGKKCAVSENNIIFKKVINLEAAHIKWHAEGGLSHPTNGIPLCRDLHWAFDRGMFTIEQVGEDYKINIHPLMSENNYLSKFKNSLLRKPNDLRYLPKDEYLKWHKKNIYGNFSKH